MAKKKKIDAQPAAEVKQGSESQEKVKEQKAPKSGIITTEGNKIDKINVNQPKSGRTMVFGVYEREGRKPVKLFRPVTAEQAKEFQRLHAVDKAAALSFIANAAFPMHADDAAFHKRDGEVNGRPVNYIVLEKITESSLLELALHKSGVDIYGMSNEERSAAIAAMSEEAKTAALKDGQGLLGKFQLSIGEKGNKDSRFYGIVNNEELASIRHRAEVVLDNKGGVKETGAPLSMLDIAARFEQRVLSQRQAVGDKLEAAEKVDWSKFKFPEGTKFDYLRWDKSKNNPDRVMMYGAIGGIKVSSLLSVNESTAVRNKLATLEQAAAANRDFNQKVSALVGNAPAEAKAISEDAAVKVVIDRASDRTAKAFTAEQRNTLLGYAAGAETPEDREKLFDGLWEKAESALKDAGINEAWQKDAHAELKELAHGVARDEQQGLKR